MGSSRNYQLQIINCEIQLLINYRIHVISLYVAMVLQFRSVLIWLRNPCSKPSATDVWNCSYERWQMGLKENTQLSFRMVAIYWLRLTLNSRERAQENQSALPQSGLTHGKVISEPNSSKLCSCSYIQKLTTHTTTIWVCAKMVSPQDWWFPNR